MRFPGWVCRLRRSLGAAIVLLWGHTNTALPGPLRLGDVDVSVHVKGLLLLVECVVFHDAQAGVRASRRLVLLISSVSLALAHVSHVASTACDCAARVRASRRFQ